MAVEAVVNNITLAAREPFEERPIGPLEGGLPGFEPVQLAGQVIPELEAVRQRPLIERLVIIEAFRLHVGSNISILHDPGGRRKDAFFYQNSVSIIKQVTVTAHIRVSSSRIKGQTKRFVDQ